MIARCVTLLLAGAVALTACGDDTSGPSSTPTSIQLLSGNNQVGTVFQSLPNPIAVRVTDIRGRGVSGATVNFEITTGGGTFVADIVGGGLASGGGTAQIAGAVTTDANGEAEANWVLGPPAGEQRATATVAGVGSVTFTATAQAGAPALLTLVSGVGQEGSTGEQLPSPLVVGVRDDVGNAVPGVVVNWTVTVGGGELPSASSQTDASGNASTTVTLRAPGPLEVTASVSGVPPVAFPAFALGTGSLDFVAARGLVDGVVDLFLSQAPIQSLIALTPLIDGTVTAAAVLPVRSQTRTLRGLTSAFRLKIVELLTTVPSASRAMDIPPGLLGQTLVYDPSTTSYVIDPSRTGAPANGVRFVLYEVHPTSGLPVEPLVEIGHADVVDTGSPPSVAISITVTAAGGATVLAYDITGTFTQTNLDVTGSGFVSDGATQFDFDVDFQATPTSALIAFAVEIGDFVVGYEQVSDASGPGSFEFGLAGVSGEDSLVALMLFDEFDTVLAGSDVKFNGTKVAFFSGTLSSVLLTNVEGNPFTLDELNALVSYIVAVDSLAGLFIDLLLFGFIFL